MRLRLLVLSVLVLGAGLPAASGGSCLILEAGLHTVDQLLTIGPGECLIVKPRAVLVGSGRLEVWGNLTVQGDPSGRAEVSVPMLIAPGGVAHLSVARVWRVGTTALDVHGEAELRDVFLEGNGVGILVEDGAKLTATALSARGNAQAALRALNGSETHIGASAFLDNAIGIDVRGAFRIDVTGSSFLHNGEHVNATVDGVEGMLLKADDFGPTQEVAGRPGVVLSAPGPLHRLVGSEENRYHNLAVALRASGPSLTLESRNDTFEANAVGIDLRTGASVKLHGARLGNGADFQGTDQGEVLLDGVVYLTNAPPSSSFPVWARIAVLVGVLVAAGGSAIGLRRVRARTVPVSAPAPLEPGEAAFRRSPSAQPPSLPPKPLTPQERRILQDARQHPDTPQSAMAERLGLSRQALHYHVKKLEARGLLGKTSKGRETLCRLLPEGDAALAILPDVAPSGEANTI